jgi:hypothetical protein
VLKETKTHKAQVVEVCDWLLDLLAPDVHNALGDKIPGSAVTKELEEEGVKAVAQAELDRQFKTQSSPSSSEPLQVGWDKDKDGAAVEDGSGVKNSTNVGVHHHSQYVPPPPPPDQRPRYRARCIAYINGKDCFDPTCGSSHPDVCEHSEQATGRIPKKYDCPHWHLRVPRVP